MAVYHSSKAALNMLTKCMAVEWAPLNINVNAVGPGLTKTEFSGALLFPCSDDSAYITGETIYVDGGRLANY